MQFRKGKAMDEIVSLLGEGAEISGEIFFAKSMRIDGFVKGKIRSDASLIIGSGGKVDADVNVRRISINGEFHGIIHASERVEIHREGRVYGDIYCPCLIIDAGAIFEGRCNMSDSSMSKKDEGVLLKAVDRNPDITAKLPTKS
jgi:cytoskeletal protein CcmA (bactofilin family)